MTAAWLNLDGDNVLAGGAGTGFCDATAFLTPVDAMNATAWWECNSPHVHWAIFDLGLSYLISQVRGRSIADYDPTDVDIYVTDDMGDWGVAVTTGIANWCDIDTWDIVNVANKQGRYVLVKIPATEGGASEPLEFGKLEETFFSIFDVYGDVPPKLLTGIVTIESTVTGHLTALCKLAGETVIASTVTGELTKTSTKALSGVVAIESATSGAIKLALKFSGTSAIASTTSGILKATRELSGVVTIASATAGILGRDRKIAGSMVLQSTGSGAINERTRGLTGTTIISSIVTGEMVSPIRELAGTCGISSTVTGELTTTGIQELSGVIAITSAVSGEMVSPIRELAGTAAITSTTAGELESPTRALSGVITIASTVPSSELTRDRALSGTVAISSTSTAEMVSPVRLLAGTTVIACTVPSSELTITAEKLLSGVVTIASTTPSSELTRTRGLASTVAIASTVTGELESPTRALSGISVIVSTVPSSELTKTAVKELAGVVTITTTTTGQTKRTRGIAGTVVIASTVEGALKALRTLIGSVAITTIVTGELSKTGVQTLSGVVTIVSTASGNLVKIYVYVPAVMKSLFEAIYTRYEESVLADKLTGLYNTEAPAAAIFPYSIFQLVFVRPDNFASGRRYIENIIVQFNLFDKQPDCEALLDAHTALVATFDHAPLDVEGYTILSCVREGTLQTRLEKVWQINTLYRVKAKLVA